MGREVSRLFAHIPTPEAVREKLAETQRLAWQLRALLTLSQQIHTQQNQTAKPEAANADR
jgi:hypothetical protein